MLYIVCFLNIFREDMLLHTQFVHLEVVSCINNCLFQQVFKFVSKSDSTLV